MRTVGAVEGLALIAVGDHRHAAIPFGAGDTASAMLAADEPALKVAGVPIGEIRGRPEGRHARIVQPKDTVVRDDGKQQAPHVAEPDRPFGPAKTARNALNMRAT